MKWDLSIRLAAASFYEQSDQCQKEAGDKLVAYLQGGKVPSKPGEFCRSWWQKLKETGSVENKQKSGRPGKIPESLAANIAAAIESDMNLPEPKQYVSITEVLQAHPELNEEVVRLGVHVRTVRRALLKSHRGSLQFLKPNNIPKEKKDSDPPKKTPGANKRKKQPSKEVKEASRTLQKLKEKSAFESEAEGQAPKRPKRHKASKG